jgi:dihydrolipoamide dehydrogenase
MEKQKFDIVVIGAGPGGYPAAIRAAQRGKRVALIEANEVGGTCLNRGCIPSKALIANAELFSRLRVAKEFGISIGEPSFDFSQMADRKDRIVANLRKNVETLLSSNRISLFRGFGQFVAPKEIKVTGKDNALLVADKVIIATGSEPRSIPSFPCDGEKIHDSTSLLALKSLPKSLVIIGGGVIGCEFASLYATLGVKVTILEMLPRLIPMEAKEVSQALDKAFEKKGMKIYTDVKVETIDRKEAGIEVKIANGAPIEAEMALVAVGRTLNTSKIGLEKAGIVVQDNGLISVNDKMETNVDGVYAIGDIASKWWLAYVATHQGLVAADNACGHEAHMHYDAVPSVIFTHPEIATVGLSFDDAVAKGYRAKKEAFPFLALGKAQAVSDTEGFAQMVVDEKTGQVLGAQVVGFEASTLISEMSLAIANELTLECLTETLHPHPTFGEIWLEAGLLAAGKPIHLPPKIKKR